MSIGDNVKRVRAKIFEAETAAGAKPGSVLLVAATKLNSAERIREAADAGIDAAGENRVQELLEKLPQGAYEGLPLHFIGHLQKNKVKDVVGVCSLIESVDSPELLAAIGRRADALGICQQVLIEVNIGGEAQKSGVKPAELGEILDRAEAISGVSVQGLMTVPPISAYSGQNRVFFDAMYQLFVDIRAKKRDNISMRFLSMGMSADYSDAIAAGANMVRVGTAIFGARDYRH